MYRIEYNVQEKYNVQNTYKKQSSEIYGDKMKKVTKNAYGKVNLALGITGVREDGYHLVDMIMHKLELHDEVTVEAQDLDEAQEGDILPVSMEILGNSALSAETNAKLDSNLCVKAYKKYFEGQKKRPEIRISLKKNIPMAAGLAGGSADGAAVLAILNEIYGLYSYEELLEIATKLGADVPFCLAEEKCQRCEGIGEILTPLPSISGVDIVLAKIKEGMSTPECYKSYDKMWEENSGNIIQPDIGKCIEKLRLRDVVGLEKVAYNVLEPVTVAKYNHLLDVEKVIYEQNSDFVRMTGSGPTIFGLFTHYDEKSYQNLVSIKPDITFLHTRML